MKSLILILALCFSVQSQTKTPPVEKCSLTPEQSPLVREMKLGQIYFPHTHSVIYSDDTEPSIYTSERDADIGIIYETLNNILRRSGKYEGILRIESTYLDGKLASFEIHYDGSTRWKSSKHFAAAIAEQLHLPTVGWTDPYRPRLNCDGFFVEASAPLYSILTIERTELQSEIANRRAMVEQKKRTNFKP